MTTGNEGQRWDWRGAHRRDPQCSSEVARATCQPRFPWRVTLTWRSGEVRRSGCSGTEAEFAVPACFPQNFQEKRKPRTSDPFLSVQVLPCARPSFLPSRAPVPLGPPVTQQYFPSEDSSGVLGARGLLPRGLCAQHAHAHVTVYAYTCTYTHAHNHTYVCRTCNHIST